MRRIRLFHQESFQVDDLVHLQGDAARYLLQVLRKKVGDQFWIFNGDSREYFATIIEAEKKKAIIKIESFTDPANESPVKIHLGQGVSRGDRMDYAIQKAVELGVFEITPLITAYCQVKLVSDRIQKRVSHWQSIAVSAAEQSGRCVVPIVHQPISFDEWVESNDAQSRFICCPRQAHQAFREDSFASLQTVSVSIGPEGGFSDNEIAQSIENGFSSLSLGPRVLRTETAAVVALTLLQSQFGGL